MAVTACHTVHKQHKDVFKGWRIRGDGRIEFKTQPHFDNLRYDTFWTKFIIREITLRDLQKKPIDHSYKNKLINKFLILAKGFTNTIK